MTQHVAGDADPRFATYMGPIRFRSPTASDRPVFDKIPIDLLADPETAPLVADAIKGRYILIGGDFSDFDQFDTPFTRTGNPVTGETRMIGVEVHASMLAQLLDKALTLPPPVAIKVLAALLAVGLGAVTAAVRTRTWLLALAVIGQFGLFLGLPFLIERAGMDTLRMPAMGWLVGWLIAYTAISAALRAINAAQREFAQGALGKYLPRSVASEIMRNPERLSLHGEKRGDILPVQRSRRVHQTDSRGRTRSDRPAAQRLSRPPERGGPAIWWHAGQVRRRCRGGVLGRADRLSRRWRARRPRGLRDVSGRRGISQERARRRAPDRPHPRGAALWRGDRRQLRRKAASSTPHWAMR
jgi:hypothetical protein